MGSRINSPQTGGTQRYPSIVGPGKPLRLGGVLDLGGHAVPSGIPITVTRTVVNRKGIVTIRPAQKIFIEGSFDS